MSRSRDNADLGDNYGTFSGTIGSATFPAGNVINLEVKQVSSGGSFSLTTTDQYITDNEFTYQVKEQTSKVYIEYHPLFQCEHDDTVYSHKLSLRSDVDSYASTLGGGNVPQMIHFGSTSQVQHLQFPVIVSCFHDHNQTAGTTITYRMYGQTKTGTAGVYTWDTWSHSGGPTQSQHAVIYEVAQ